MTDDEKTHMENAEVYRAKAAEAAETVRTVSSLKHGSEARKSQKAYTMLADNEDWLGKKKPNRLGRLPPGAEKQ